jgi:hypothetical protein
MRCPTATNAREDLGVCLFADGARMQVKEVKAWKMAASNPW